MDSAQTSEWPSRHDQTNLASVVDLDCSTIEIVGTGCIKVFFNNQRIIDVAGTILGGKELNWLNG